MYHADAAGGNDVACFGANPSEVIKRGQLAPHTISIQCGVERCASHHQEERCSNSPFCCSALADTNLAEEFGLTASEGSKWYAPMTQNTASLCGHRPTRLTPCISLRIRLKTQMFGSLGYEGRYGTACHAGRRLLPVPGDTQSTDTTDRIQNGVPGELARGAD